jgi:hypothetical protein
MRSLRLPLLGLPSGGPSSEHPVRPPTVAATPARRSKSRNASGPGPVRSNMAAADSIDAAARSLRPQEQWLLSGRRVSAGSRPQGQKLHRRKNCPKPDSAYAAGLTHSRRQHRSPPILCFA